jgi:protease I
MFKDAQYSWTSAAALRGLGCVLVARAMSEEAAWIIAPPGVSLQLQEPDAMRSRWRVARYEACEPDQLVIALGQHVADSYAAVTVDDVRSVVPPELQDWITTVCERLQTLADGFGRQNPQEAPNEAHVRAASTRFAELAGATESKDRANSELEGADLYVPDTVDELLSHADREGHTRPSRRPAGHSAHMTRRTVTATQQDAAAMVRLLTRTQVEQERPGSADHSYLDHLIAKPWGSEFRVYDDALVDVWLLRLDAGSQTSMHCHPRKDTVLLCLHGEGVLITGDSRRLPMGPGSVTHIKPGAAHRTLSRTGLTLVEIETPRDKFDQIRLDDASGRAGRAYESADAVERELDPLQRVTNGPPRARLRPATATGAFSFELERGVALQPGADGLTFAISLDASAILRHEILIAGPDTLSAVPPDHTYLTIRWTAPPMLRPEEAISPPDSKRDPRHKRELAARPEQDAQVKTLTQLPTRARNGMSAPRVDPPGADKRLAIRAVIVTGPGFQDHDNIYCGYRLREAHFQVDFATADGAPVTGKYGTRVPLDARAKPCIAFDDLDVEEFDIVVLTGGHEASDRVRQDRRVREFVRDMDARGKIVAGLCHGPWIMISAGIMNGRRASAYPGLRDDIINAGAHVVDADVVVDRNMVTCSYYGELGLFMQTVVELCRERAQLAPPCPRRA